MKMLKRSLAELYEKQVSFTEWFSRIRHRQTEALREEDNTKRERLALLNTLINLPYDKPVQFPASALTEKSAAFQDYLKQQGNDLCALRLMPLQKGLPTLRIRGLSVLKAVEWFHHQNIDVSQYHTDFVPHSEKQVWSTIFIIHQQGVFGEIIRGGLHQLSQGFYEGNRPILFSYDFRQWSINADEAGKNHAGALKHLKEVMQHLAVPKHLQTKMKENLSAFFSNDFLCGYFETTHSDDQGLWFVDYNRLLGDLYLAGAVPPASTFATTKATAAEGFIYGQCASQGKVRGRIRSKVKVVSDPFKDNLEQGEILVTTMTTPDFLPLMQKAAAVITDLGGILSHAAVVCRELGIPSVTGTMDATRRLRDGDFVEVDAQKGVVRKVKFR